MLNFINIIKDNYFIAIFLFTIFVIILLSLFRVGKKGTWSKTYIPHTYLIDTHINHKKKTKKTKKNIYASKILFLKKKKKKYSKGETICRNILEQLFKKPFPSCRPDFLKNNAIDRGNNMELDCFNEKLKIAIEYNGKQHYEYIPFFHKNKEAFQNQQYRDFIKKKICKDNNIFLISVPYTVKYIHIKNYIIKELKKRKIKKNK